MLALLPLVLGFMSEVAPMISTATAVAKAIQQLTVLVPVVVKEARELAPMVKSTIAALRGNGSITDEQLAELDAMEAKFDADFDAAAAKAEAEDAAAEGNGQPAT